MTSTPFDHDSLFEQIGLNTTHSQLGEPNLMSTIPHDTNQSQFMLNQNTIIPNDEMMSPGIESNTDLPGHQPNSRSYLPSRIGSSIIKSPLDPGQQMTHEEYESEAYQLKP